MSMTKHDPLSSIDICWFFNLSAFVYSFVIYVRNFFTSNRKQIFWAKFFHKHIPLNVKWSNFDY